MSGADPVAGGAAAPEGVDVLWINAGLSCDGDSVALTAARRPSIEDLAAGIVPGAPPVRFHWPMLAYEVGERFLEPFHRAAAGELDRFVLVIEGSMPNEQISGEGSWAAFGADPDTGQPVPTVTWIERLAPRAWSVLAAGTCASYGGMHAMEGNATGAMGLPDLLGWDWTARSGLPVVCLPGCPTHPDSLSRTLLWLVMHAAGTGPAPPLDDSLRPAWIFGPTVHEGCDRAGYYEQGQFAERHGSARCIVKLGCWGPVVRCNVPKDGWMNGVGGCPNVGGICIGCTMPGFPDKFQPFMDEPPGGKLSSTMSRAYGSAVRRLRDLTIPVLEQEPAWRTPGPELLTGYQPAGGEDDGRRRRDDGVSAPERAAAGSEAGGEDDGR